MPDVECSIGDWSDEKSRSGYRGMAGNDWDGTGQRTEDVRGLRVYTHTFLTIHAGGAYRFRVVALEAMNYFGTTLRIGKTQRSMP